MLTDTLKNTLKDTLTDTLNRIRRNHALEHAVVTLLIEREVAAPPLGGYSTRGGFFIVAAIPTAELASVVTDALAKLNAGETELAVSPHCGTNLATGALITSLITRIVIGKRQMPLWKRLPLFAASAIAGGILGRKIGNHIQRRYTTLARMDALQVVSITPVLPGDPPRLHRIATRIPASDRLP